MSRRVAHGFSAVELLITIIVAMVLLGGIWQIYTAIINDAASSRNRAKASSIAYTQARAALASLTAGSCTAQNPFSLSSLAFNNNTAPSLSSLPNASITAKIDCPYVGMSGAPTISRVTVTVTYGTTGETVSHVLYK
jgi:Tfp pilus assembly protein PilV